LWAANLAMTSRRHAHAASARACAPVEFSLSPRKSSYAPPPVTPSQASIDANKPPGAKGVYWKSMYVCTTMGPSVRVNISALQSLSRE
jgi:hypothetical protein